MLLQLAHDLLERARYDETLPIPVVFSLSTWAAKRASLTEWCVEELSQKYHIPKKIGKVWVEKHRVLPLLDGFDEVAEECRAKCASAINAYLQGYGALLPLVIVSRTMEYVALTTKIAAQRAVEVQPLTPTQIQAYLQEVETQGGVLQVAFRDDAGFRALMKNPLMLSLLKKTYQGKQVQELAMGVSLEALKDQIFPTYVRHMLQRRCAEHCYTSEKTIGWLAWLATQMKQRGQHEFYLERLQVEWLTDRRPYKLYTSVAFGVISFLVTIPVNSFLFSDPLKGSLVALLDGALALLFVWLIETGVHGGSPLFSMQRRFPFFTWSDTRSAGHPGLSSGVRHLLGDRLVYALFCGFLDGALVEGLVGPAYGLVHGLFYAAFYVVLGKLDRHIQPAEILTWSLTSVKRAQPPLRT